MKEFIPDGDVLDRFMSSQADVKIIQGPIGSGKTLGCEMVIYTKGIEQVKQADGKRRCRAHVFRECFDDQTEILTERRGWVLFKDLARDDKVAQLNGDRLEFVQPIDYIANPYVGELIGFESEGVDFRVTPQHRLWVSRIHGRKREWQPFGFECAEDAFGGDVRVRRDAEWPGIDPGHTEAVFEWLGLWFAEGYGNTYRQADGYSRKKLGLTQCKPGGIAYARGLIARAGIPCSEISRTDRGVNFMVLVRPETKWLFDALCDLGGARQKALPQWIKDAPSGHLRAFLKGYIFGDGYTSNGTTKATTASEALANDLQEIALKAGMVANLVRVDLVVSKAANARGIVANGPSWSLTFVTPKKFRPRLNEKYRERKQYRRWYRERYVGTVYCVEVPTHVIYVRRNGKAFWCGQTYAKLEDTTLKSWLEWFPEHEFGKFYWSKPMFHEIRVGDLELDVHFVALEDETAVAYFRSLETTICWFNELQFTPKILFDEAVSRVGRYPRTIDGGAVRPQVIADMNAPDETHWVPIMRGDVAVPDWFTEEQRNAHRKPLGWEFFVQPAGLLEVKDAEGGVSSYEPNPIAENLKYLPPNYYMKAIQGKTKSWIDANVMNRVSPRRDGKPVLPDFNRAVHVAKKPIEAVPGVPLVVGCDFGRRPCAIFMQHIRGTWYVLHELIARDMGASKFAPLLRNDLAQKFPGFTFKIWGDPSGDFKGQNDEQTPYQIFRAQRLPILPAPNILFTVRLQSIEAVLTRMSEGKPALLVSPTCNTLVAALDGGWHYRRMKTAGEHYSTEPEKDEYSDPADAFGYGLLGGGEGHMLLTGSSEPARVLAPMRGTYHPYAKRTALRGR